jgi:hypothetical protein
MTILEGERRRTHTKNVGELRTGERSCEDSQHLARLLCKISLEGGFIPCPCAFQLSDATNPLPNSSNMTIF